MHTISNIYFYRLEQQMSFFKASASQTTVSNTELFFIRLDIAKVSSMDIELIIPSTGSARKTVDSSVYSGQAYSLAVYFVHSSLVALTIGLNSGTVQSMLSGSFTN